MASNNVHAHSVCVKCTLLAESAGKAITMESSETSTLPIRRKRINRTDLAYAAGLFDGEGCVCAMWNSASPTPGQKKRYMTIRVGIVNTNLQVLEWIQERFGGGIYRSCVPAGHKTKWEWRCSAAELKWFLKLMIPLLKIKARQARLALVLRSMIERKSAEPRKRRIFEMIRTLNNGKDPRKLSNDDTVQAGR